MNRHIIWAPSAEIEYCIALQISTTSLKCSQSIRTIYCYFSVSTDHYLPLAFQCLAILGNVILEAGSRRYKWVCHPFPLSCHLNLLTCAYDPWSRLVSLIPWWPSCLCFFPWLQPGPLTPNSLWKLISLALRGIWSGNAYSQCKSFITSKQSSPSLPSKVLLLLSGWLMGWILERLWIVTCISVRSFAFPLPLS